jgi:hypothetical protein
MDRDMGQDEREWSERSGAERTSELIPDRERAPAARERQAVLERGRAYQISPAERETMYEIGRFRTVAVEDLARNKYMGNTAQMRQDLRALIAQGLVQRHTACIGKNKGKLAVLVLSKKGKKLLEASRETASAQAIYAGFVKPSEVAHDAAIYRMYQAEAALIQKRGGTIGRVVLDYELKRRVYSPLAKAKQLPAGEYRKRQGDVARENGLKVVRGKIPLPDLRIEYQTREGELARVDLELATRHYHGSHMSAKAQAGFKIYAAEGSGSFLSRVLDEHDITAELLSL